MEIRGKNAGVYVALLMLIAAADSTQKFTGERCIDSMGRDVMCTARNQHHRVQRDVSTLSPPSLSPVKDKILGEKAKKWCNEYSKICPEGNGNTGGIIALPHEFPHMAEIGYGEQSDIKWLCGGSLISEKFVLTAAHCINNAESRTPKWVLLGTVNLVANESLLGNTGQIHRVVRSIRHPGYKPPIKYNDVGLLEIGPAITKNPRPLVSTELHPACLRTDDSIKYDTYIKSAWGTTEFGGSISQELLRRELRVIDEDKCNEIYNTTSSRHLSRGIDSTMMCAEVIGEAGDVCRGDAGAPLQVSTIGTCQYEISGFASFGVGCFKPAVYSKVSAFIEWIEDNVWPE